MITMMERKVRVSKMELRSRNPKLMITMTPRKMQKLQQMHQRLLRKRLNQFKLQLKLKIRQNGLMTSMMESVVMA